MREMLFYILCEYEKYKWQQPTIFTQKLKLILLNMLFNYFLCTQYQCGLNPLSL